MVKLDCYASAGFALELLAQSKYHKPYKIENYFRTEILPAFWANQVRFYLNQESIPTAMVTWAWISEDVEKDIHATGRALAPREWNCGTRLFVNDLIAPYSNSRDVINDIIGNVFANYRATSLRRHPDGSIRRVNHWIGVNLRRCQKKEVA